MYEDSEDLRASANTELSAFVQKALTESTGLQSVKINGTEYYMASSPTETVGWAVVSVIGKSVTEQPAQALLREYDEINDKARAEYSTSSRKLDRQTLAVILLILLLGILEISTGRLTCANAGHEYPVLKKAGGAFEIIKDQHSFAVGGMEGIRYKEYTLQHEKGDKLFLYTDGVPEATDAESNMFGTAQMLGALNAEPDAKPEQLLRNVRSAVSGFVKDAEQFDDLTMLCIEYSGKRDL